MEAKQSDAIFFSVRLKPGADLRLEIQALADLKRIQAGVIVSCVGSLKQVSLRYADTQEQALIHGKFEIISLQGTFGIGAGHFHLAVADGRGDVKGGHLLEGNIIYTTAEVVVADLTAVTFTRETDPTYGYRELIIKSRG